MTFRHLVVELDDRHQDVATVLSLVCSCVRDAVAREEFDRGSVVSCAVTASWRGARDLVAELAPRVERLKRSLRRGWRVDVLHEALRPGTWRVGLEVEWS